MNRQKFEEYLKKLNPKIRVVRPSNWNEEQYYGNKDGIYFHNEFVCAIPPGEIYLHENKGYTDKQGTPHRALISIISKLINKKVITGGFHAAFNKALKKLYHG